MSAVKEYFASYEHLGVLKALSGEEKQQGTD